MPKKIPICDCPTVCKTIDDYISVHIHTIPSWGEQTEMENLVHTNRPEVEKMLKDEKFAKLRRAKKAERDAERAATGYVAVPQPRCKGPKPFCRNCTVEYGIVTANRCCNYKCSFNHGKYDRRPEVRQASE